MRSACAALALLIAACAAGPQPITQIDDQPIPAGLSLHHVQEIVWQAMVDEDWIVLRREPDELIMSRHVGEQSATVRVGFSPASYRIVFLSARNLNHDRDTGMIDGVYNQWISDLRRRIDTLLAAG